MITRILTLGVLLFAIMFSTSVAEAQLVPAQWPHDHTATGVPVFVDLRTGKHWTMTLGRVPSSGWGAPARLLVAAQGPNWHLPTFRELQGMYNISGGGPALHFRDNMNDYYETANPHILANAYGNGIQTPQYRRGIGYNWVIAVKR